MSDQMDKMESTQEIGTEQTAKEKRAAKKKKRKRITFIIEIEILHRAGMPQSRKRLSEMLLRSKNRAARLQLKNVPTLASAAAVSICTCPTRNSSLQRSIR